MAAEAVGNYEHSQRVVESAIPILPTTLREIPLWLSTRAVKRRGGRTYLIGTGTRGLPVLCQFRVNTRIVS